MENLAPFSKAEKKTNSALNIHVIPSI